MGIRTQVIFEARAGRANDLSDLVGEMSLSSTFDTMDHALAYEVTLGPGEENHEVPFGDISELRVLAVRAETGLSIAPAGGLATSAQTQAAGGTFPTGFAGGETLDFDVDGVTVAVAFDVLDQTLDAVVNRINGAVALAGLRAAAQPAIAAFLNGGQLLLRSPTSGAASALVLRAGTANAVLGLPATTTVAGVNASAGQSPLVLQSPAIDGDLPPFAVVSLTSPGLTLTNLSTESSNRVSLLLVGDLLSEVPGAC